jgi:ribosomal-protein-alanine N-acetyltransferase
MEFETVYTERLVLRKLTPQNYITIFENYPVPEIKKLLGLDSDEAFLKEKNKYENGYTTYNRSFVLFQLMERSSGTIIGACGLHNWYPDHRRAELGYTLYKDSYKRMGFMSEAVPAVIAYGFTRMNLHRMEALVGAENVPSIKLVRKNNFRQEGVLRQHYFSNDVFEDSIVFGLLRDEFLQHRG